MTCPYAVNRQVVTQTTLEYDEGGNQTMQQTLENSTAQFVLCVQEHCGAWRDGRCQYRGIE